MPESIDPKAIYSSSHIANLLGTTEQNVVEAFHSGMLRGRAIGSVWYCSGKSLLRSLSTETARPATETAVKTQPPAVESPAPAPTPKQPQTPPPVAAKTEPSETTEESPSDDPKAKKRYLAKQVEQAVKKTGSYNEAAHLLNQQGTPSLSGDPWSHRSVGNVLRWARQNKR